MPAPERRAVRLMVATVVWLILALLAIVGVVAAYQATLTERIPVALKAVLAMPVVFVGLTVCLIVTAAIAWRRGYWSLGRRAHYSLVAIAAMMICWFFYQWNILGWQFG